MRQVREGMGQVLMLLGISVLLLLMLGLILIFGLQMQQLWPHIITLCIVFGITIGLVILKFVGLGFQARGRL